MKGHRKNTRTGFGLQKVMPALLEEDCLSQAEELVCYCFGYSRQNILEDAGSYGRSLIMERIMAASRAGICNCAASNPRRR